MNRKEISNGNDRNIVKGLVAGVAGGLVASFVMDQFQYAWMAVAESVKNGAESEQEEKKKESEEQEPANIMAAEAISEKVFGHHLAEGEKEYAGQAVHYVTGGGSAAIYGAAAEIYPEVTVGAGMPFGTAVWLIVDEGAVPALGLSKSPLEYPASNHVYALASHLVYGLTTEYVRRSVRSVL